MILHFPTDLYLIKSTLRYTRACGLCRTTRDRERFKIELVCGKNRSTIIRLLQLLLWSMSKPGWRKKKLVESNRNGEGTCVSAIEKNGRKRLAVSVVFLYDRFDLRVRKVWNGGELNYTRIISEKI